MRKLILEALIRRPLTDPAPPSEDAAAQELAVALERAARKRLGRSLAIRQVDAGSCNGCELEINALANVFYDLERFGLKFVASPRHADVLLVTGPVTKNMREALERTWTATPEPKWVVALGDCAKDGGVFAGSYACVGGVGSVVPVDLHIPGCPPSPRQILAGYSRSSGCSTRPPSADGFGGASCFAIEVKENLAQRERAKQVGGGGGLLRTRLWPKFPASQGVLQGISDEREF